MIDSKSWVDSDGLNADDVSFGRIPDGGGGWQLFGAGQSDPCTPGATNQGATNLPPAISYVGYTQLQIPPTYAMDIHAQVTDPDGTVADEELVWQTDSSTNFTSMTLDDTYYSAQIGPFEGGEVITYHIQALDNDGAITNSLTYHITVGFFPLALYINELMPSNSSTIAEGESEFEDWVEIYNPNDYAVDLAGYYLTDDHYDFGAGTFIMDPVPDGYPGLTTVPAHGYIIAWFDEDLAQGPMHIDTKLGSSADAVYLIATDMINVIDQVTYANIPGMATDVSWGRYPDGSDTWQIFGVGQFLPATPGAANGGSAVDDPGSPALVPALTLYPNPLRGSLNLEIKNATGTADIAVFNLKGQKVGSFQADGKTVWKATDSQGRRLAGGIYFLKTTLNGTQINRKICILP